MLLALHLSQKLLSYFNIGFLSKPPVQDEGNKHEFHLFLVLEYIHKKNNIN